MNLAGQIIVAQPTTGLIPPQSFVVVADYINRDDSRLLLVRTDGGLLSSHVLAVRTDDLHIIAHYTQDEVIEAVADSLQRVLDDPDMTIRVRAAMVQTRNCLLECLGNKVKRNTIPFESLSEVPQSDEREFTIRIKGDVDVNEIARALKKEITKRHI